MLAITVYIVRQSDNYNLKFYRQHVSSEFIWIRRTFDYIYLNKTIFVFCIVGYCVFTVACCRVVGLGLGLELRIRVRFSVWLVVSNLHSADSSETWS